MKKNLILTSVAAIMTTIAGANAATDVTFAGNYTNSNGDTVNVSDAVAAQTYSYEKSDHTTRNVADQNTGPTLSDFTYTDKDGGAADLSSGEKSQSYFAGTSAASGVVSTTQEIVSGADVERSNYTYTNGAGDDVVLGTEPQNMIQNVGLDATYTSGTQIAVTNGTADSAFDGTIYSVTVSDETYHLSADGTKLVNSHDIEVSPTTGSALETEFNAMKGAYITDVASVDAAKTETAAQWTTEQANFATANTAFETDTTTVSTLNGYWNTYETAADLLETAQQKQNAAKEAYNANTADLTDALGIYDKPIATTIDNRANDAIDASVESGSIKTALDTKANTADVYTKDAADAKFLTEHQDISGKANVADVELALNGKADKATTLSGYGIEDAYTKSDVDTLISNEATARSDADDALQLKIDAEKDRATTAEDALQQAITDEATARSNADQQLQQQINASIANSDALTLSKANSYTDAKVNTLEKNMSGGVAAATALSSVAVSNVGKGEVSVGGGYGYYNSQSAIAFGAAMGLSDRWSVNAGAGIASGDKTQVSFRAGTNYKFKLF